MSLILQELEIGDLVRMRNYPGTYRIINKLTPLIYDVRECYTRSIKYNIDIDELCVYQNKRNRNKKRWRSGKLDNNWDNWDNWDKNTFSNTLNKYKNQDTEKKQGGGWVEISNPNHNTYTYHESWLNPTQQKLSDMWSKDKPSIKPKNKVVIDLTKKKSKKKKVRSAAIQPVKKDKLDVLAEVCSKSVEIKIEKPSQSDKKEGVSINEKHPLYSECVNFQNKNPIKAPSSSRYNLRRSSSVNYSGCDEE